MSWLSFKRRYWTFHWFQEIWKPWKIDLNHQNNSRGVKEIIKQPPLTLRLLSFWNLNKLQLVTKYFGNLWSPATLIWFEKRTWYQVWYHDINRNMISIISVFDCPHKLLNNLRLSTLGNYEIEKKFQNLVSSLASRN